jgi:hypothetical protein
MKLEQNILIKYLWFKGLKLLDIYYKLVRIFGKETYTYALIKHWIHELKTRQTIIADKDRSRRFSIDYIDMLILKTFDEIYFSLV